MIIIRIATRFSLLPSVDLKNSLSFDRHKFRFLSYHLLSSQYSSTGLANYRRTGKLHIFGILKKIFSQVRITMLGIG